MDYELLVFSNNEHTFTVTLAGEGV